MNKEGLVALAKEYSYFQKGKQAEVQGRMLTNHLHDCEKENKLDF